MPEQAPTVLAIILTHDAPESLVRCLRAIAAQTRPVDDVLVVDNASTPPATPGTEGLRLEVLRSEHNGGPAGGWEIGLRAFLERDQDLAWVIDDDCIPAPACLAELIAARAFEDAEWPVFPLWVDGPTGEGRFMPAWCGFLMPRSVVEQVGLPRADLVWWTEDTEYLQDRLRRADIWPIHAPRAIVEHHRVRTGASKPPWKYYYEVRNTIEYRYFVQDRTARRVRRMVRSVGKLIAQIVMHEPHKAVRLRAAFDGIVDGARRRSGMRYPLDSKT